MGVMGVEGSRVLVERYLPPHDTVLKRYRVAKRLVHRARAMTAIVSRNAAGRLRVRAWLPFDWQNDWGGVAFRCLGQRYHNGLGHFDNTR